ncbi:NAD(P)H-flavin reductase [Pokkaliibacter sp. CJK22405]|uniref:NAD(P)H-flavin reductase n=1 Tax=Pokkaliibacter sp. CJK22405 TaxID=3384615 RepID=UPI0039846DB1
MTTATSPSDRPVVTHACQVVDIRPLSTGTFEIELAAPAGTVLDYHAGQYLQMDIDVQGDGKMQRLSYTIANSCDAEKPRYLQVFLQTGSPFSNQLLTRLGQLKDCQQPLNITLALGRAYLQTDVTQPHVFIAAGSGIAKIKAITEALLRRNPEANIAIYWSNKTAGEFYLLEHFGRWATQHTNLRFTPVLEAADSEWTGRSGYLYEVIGTDFDDLSQVQTYLCGSPRMVYGTLDQLAAKGLQEHHCHSDVFEHSPREQQVAV